MLSRESAKGNSSERISRIYQEANRLSFGALEIVQYAVRRFSRVRGAEAAASLAFYTIFSVFPLLLVLVSVGSYFLESDVVRRQVLALVQSSIPVSSELLIEAIQQVFEQRNTVGLVGLAGLIWSASSVLSSLTININRAWPTARARNFLQNRLIALGMIAGLGVLLAISSISNTLLNLLFRLDVPILPEEPIWNFVSAVVPVLIVFLVFLGLYRWVPNTRVAWQAAFWAALVAALAWEVTTNAFSWYLHSGLAQYSAIYGALGTIVALMAWIYLNCLIVVFCAHLSAAIVHHAETD